VNSDPDGTLIIGRIAGAFGIKGWLRCLSYMEKPADILKFKDVMLGRGASWTVHRIREGRQQQKDFILRLAGVETRDQAEALIGWQIAIERSSLPALSECQYYWYQLQGLQVINQDGIKLGKVDRLMETGANDVLLVSGDRQRVLPWIESVIQEVDLAAGTITVDWDPEF